MKINFTDEQINDIIRLRTVEKFGVSRIGKVFGVGYKPIARVLTNAGIDTASVQAVHFTDSEKAAILSAYDSGIGANGIALAVGLNCSETPITRFLLEQRGKLRNRSEQQFARMAKATPEQIAKLTKAAHNAARGRVKRESELIKRAKTMEGRISNRSKFEPVVFDVLRKHFSDVAPAKAVGRYNLDFCVNGNVAVEVFGGGWSVSDKRRIRRYIDRTKKIAESGFHTVFVVLINEDIERLNWDEFITSVKLASSHPSSDRQYRVIWGDTQGASGLSCDIDHSAFVAPFVNVRDSATGRYKRISR